MQRRGKGVNKGWVYYHSHQDRCQQPNGKDLCHPRGRKRHNTNWGAVRAPQTDRASADYNIQVEATLAACSNGDPTNELLPPQQPRSVTKPEARPSDANETFQGTVSDDHVGTKQSARLKDVRPQSRDYKGGQKAKAENVSDNKRKGQRGKHAYVPHGIRAQNKQSGRTRDSSYSTSYKHMYGHGDSDTSAQRIVMNKSMAAGEVYYLESLHQPYYSGQFFNSEYTERNTRPTANTSLRREPSRGLSAVKKGYRRDYRSQKDDVLRALSHLNPVQSSQASVLREQLRNETYECMVCCECVQCTAPVWSCHSCYHVFHLNCVRKWAKSPAATVRLEGVGVGWRCPGCQNLAQEIPTVYRCFCGKVLDPVWKRHEGLTPHSCGELCGKQRTERPCSHRCNQLCHPGPCPSCPVMVTKQCACGKTNNRVRCGQASVVVCKQVCNKVLNCFTHRCTRICHTDACGDCQVKVQQPCYCGKQQRDAFCGKGQEGFDNVDGNPGYFSCQDKCLKALDCGNHYCQRICHPGACDECLQKPLLVTLCPCGKSLISELLNDARISCLDPVPTCGSTCNKILPCSPPTAEGNSNSPGTEHRCKQKCHRGDCGPCDGITKVKCRCGTNTKEIPCVERNLEEYMCEQHCNKKKKCGRHRCNQRCCSDAEHKCESVCGKKLRCGFHKCLEPCHPGYCPPCLMSGFNELTCHCGAAVLDPPIPCGTPPPECEKPCSRTHPCSHPVNHTCHREADCPPCTYLTKKTCMGEHKVLHNIPCHVTDVSCGNVCGKSLKCGHKCVKTCHKPPCCSTEESCGQPCGVPRKQCGHPCAAPCHPSKECPTVPCETRMTVHCKCGQRSENFPCLQGGEKLAVTQAYQRIATETLANKMKDLQSGQSVDISSIVITDEKKARQLDCNDECAVYERNKCVAEALNIENPDLSPHGGKIRFSPFLVAEAKQHLAFVKSVEDAFEKLVQTTLKMSASQSSHWFRAMNSNQRRFVHEIAVFYNCSSRSYDQEPNRNTRITATKESHLPNVKLSVQIEKEMNPPPPQPIPFLPSRVNQLQKFSVDRTPKKTQAWTQVTDYFADDFED